MSLSSSPKESLGKERANDNKKRGESKMEITTILNVGDCVFLRDTRDKSNYIEPLGEDGLRVLKIELDEDSSDDEIDYFVIHLEKGYILEISRRKKSGRALP